MVRGREWTGFEAAALQEAMRKSVRDFAALLGLETTTVNNWRTGLGSVKPRTATQEMLDTMLDLRASDDDRARFEEIVGEGEAVWRQRHSDDAHAGRAQTVLDRYAIRNDAVSREQPTPDDFARAADASFTFAQWAVTSPADQLSIEGIHYELGRIAVSYVHGALPPLFRDLQLLRDHIWQLLRDRPHPRKSRELFFLGGVTVLLLAHVTDNLSNSVVAMRQANAAAALAEQADHPGLKAWIAGTQALIAEWNRHPVGALNFARRGLPFAAPGHQRVRLAAIEARNAARLGKADDTHAALRQTRLAMDHAPGADDLQQFGGVLHFPATKALYYAGSTYALLGDFVDAERYALDAIAGYESGPSEDRSYGDEALARTDVAAARIMRGEIDGAHDALTPVLALPPSQRIYSITDGVERVGAAIDASRYARDPAALSLHQEIAVFDPSTDLRAM
ncbi:XRE family transcriptional regulator [Nocardia sp. BMG51109]|uniref:XRE family transcriptional regulator n=1 Tax=Nocardia sp. BMG51109 TaxID=1056816 RepID=UPI0004B5D6B9|nr:XRE family transcriptional regulator [Nocardia sp. BMG51109]